MDGAPPVQQFSKASIATPGAPKNLLLGSVMILLVTVGIYLFFAGYQKVAQDQIVSLDQEIQDTVASLSKDEVLKVLTLDAQIRQLKQLLPQHVIASRIFDTLEQNTLPKVTFTNISLNVGAGSLQISGIAQSLQDISLQAQAFKQVQGVNDVAIKDITIGKGANTFMFKLDVLIARSLIVSAH